MIYDILILIWLHFISDFILQSDYVAINKGKSNKILLYHCLIYSIPFIIFGVYFSIVNGILHFITDYISSRLASKYYASNRHLFFIIIGLDQAIHLTTLILTLNILR